MISIPFQIYEPLHTHAQDLPLPRALCAILAPEGQGMQHCDVRGAGGDGSIAVVRSHLQDILQGENGARVADRRRQVHLRLHIRQEDIDQHFKREKDPHLCDGARELVC